VKRKQHQQNKNLDTITSGNNLSGELFVSEPTTKTSMEAAGTSETGANPAPDSFSVPSPLPGVYDQERDAIADAAQDAASDPGIHTTAGEDKDATPEPKQPEWDKEPRKVPGTKELKKTVKSLKKNQKPKQTLLDEQKAVIASTKDRTEAITLAMTAQDEKLKALTGIVEAAIKCNLDSLNRTTAPNTVARKTNDGDSWAVDLSKRLVGGN
jgi:hypothetical protein